MANELRLGSVDVLVRFGPVDLRLLQRAARAQRKHLLLESQHKLCQKVHCHSREAPDSFHQNHSRDVCSVHASKVSRVVTANRFAARPRRQNTSMRTIAPLPPVGAGLRGLAWSLPALRGNTKSQNCFTFLFQRVV